MPSKCFSGILNEDEIQLIKAIYSRIKIKIGNETFTPNVGVAQGSVISPALFNIYAEDLYNNLSKMGVAPEDQMGYADDLFILCYSKSNLRNIINLLKSWSKENNLGLNASKSGIIEFLPRRGKANMQLTIGEEFEGIPVVSCYKYLGMWVDQKLYMTTQLDQIKKKADWISIKLWPVLKRVSLDYCKNLWSILIRPLFEQVSMLYYTERGRTNKEKVQQTLRYTFKKFTLLKKNISNDIINDLMQFDIDERAKYNMQVTKQKWEKRINGQQYVEESSTNAVRDETQETQRKIRVLPKELQTILNLQLAKCSKCPPTQICSKKHLEEHHQILIPAYKELITNIEEKTKEAKANKLSRKRTLDYVGRFITIYINRITQFLEVQNT